MRCMKKNPLETIKADESLKSFAVLLSRAIAKHPDILLELDKNHPIDIDGEGWKELYDELQDKENLAHFQKNLEESSREYDWDAINDVFTGWGRYGWITDVHLGKFGFWDQLPQTQEEADNKVLAIIDDNYLLEVRKELEEKTSNSTMLREAYFCYDNQCYFACASLLAAFIDGVLTSSPANSNSNNRKTGEGASKKILTELKKDDLFGLPGYFNLDLVNYYSFISTFFARANGFENEPASLNRNYLHHGMTNRAISQTDCIKLLIAYKKTIDLVAHDSGKE